MLKTNRFKAIGAINYQIGIYPRSQKGCPPAGNFTVLWQPLENASKRAVMDKGATPTNFLCQFPWKGQAKTRGDHQKGPYGMFN